MYVSPDLRSLTGRTARGYQIRIGNLGRMTEYHWADLYQHRPKQLQLLLFSLL